MDENELQHERRIGRLCNKRIGLRAVTPWSREPGNKSAPEHYEEILDCRTRLAVARISRFSCSLVSGRSVQRRRLKWNRSTQIVQDWDVHRSLLWCAA